MYWEGKPHSVCLDPNMTQASAAVNTLILIHLSHRLRETLKILVVVDQQCCWNIYL